MPSTANVPSPLADSKFLAGIKPPSEVFSKLLDAYGRSTLGEMGLNTHGHQFTDVSKEIEKDHNLTYGELLPAGVSKALCSERLDAHRADAHVLLELGMGTGKVALQSFLECENLQRVIGIELVPGRYAAAETAFSKLCAAHPDRYSIDRAGENAATLHDGARTLEIYCGDMFALPMEDVTAADVIFAQVVLPKEAHFSLQGLLSNAKEGCRAITYDDLNVTWQRIEPCPFHRLQANICNRSTIKAMKGFETEDLYATSWLPRGRKFFMYEVDRSRPATITIETASEVRRLLGKRKVWMYDNLYCIVALALLFWLLIGGGLALLNMYTSNGDI